MASKRLLDGASSGDEDGGSPKTDRKVQAVALPRVRLSAPKEPGVTDSPVAASPARPSSVVVYASKSSVPPVHVGEYDWDGLGCNDGGWGDGLCVRTVG